MRDDLWQGAVQRVHAISLMYSLNVLTRNTYIRRRYGHACVNVRVNISATHVLLRDRENYDLQKWVKRTPVKTSVANGGVAIIDQTQSRSK